MSGAWAVLEPGKYNVRVTIENSFVVDEGDSVTSKDLTADTRATGEMIDYEVTKGS